MAVTAPGAEGGNKRSGRESQHGKDKAKTSHRLVCVLNVLCACVWRGGGGGQKSCELWLQLPHQHTAPATSGHQQQPVKEKDWTHCLIHTDSKLCVTMSFHDFRPAIGCETVAEQEHAHTHKISHFFNVFCQKKKRIKTVGNIWIWPASLLSPPWLFGQVFIESRTSSITTCIGGSHK